MAIEQQIYEALKSRIETLPVSFEKAWPSERYHVDPSQPYIRVAFTANEPRRLLLDDDGPSRHDGFLILSVLYPLMYDLTAERYAEEPALIASHFTDGLAIKKDNTCVNITAPPYIMTGYEDSGFWCVNVRIRWSATI